MPDYISGVKREVDLTFFTHDELKIIEVFSERDWYVTRSESLNEEYRVILLKPQEFVREAFNLQRELVVLFSPYLQLDMRTIKATESVISPMGRVEEICCIVVSKDPSAVRAVDILLKNNNEARIIVPFSYKEILETPNSDFIIKRIRERFYSRDLFGIQEALTEERYFFGRREMVYELVNQHLSGSCSGVFGLRKTGKTSILYGIQRALDRKLAFAVLIDCLTLHLKSWNQALYEVLKAAVSICGVKKNIIHTELDYSDLSSAADYFLQDIESIYQANSKRSILLIFDEIENITFGTSVSEDWKSGSNFVKFWQILRSSFQKTAKRKVFTYLIAGTNPHCIELPSINKTDNPIFSQFQPHYMHPFTVEQTNEMLTKLGGYMGIGFDAEVVDAIVKDYGGHPMLMRQQCSFIHKNISGERPITITLPIYKELKDKFYHAPNGFAVYAKMIINVLRDWYAEEYQMLLWLAEGKKKDFQEFASASPELITHLLNYGIIGEVGQSYFFQIEALRRYLQSSDIGSKRVEDNQTAKNIFISYSHKDKEWLDRLNSHLLAFSKEEAGINCWSDSEIKAGDKWKQDILEALKSADIAVLLVSPDYLASPFIRTEELPLILQKEGEGKIRVLPIIVRPCAYSRSCLASVQGANSIEKTLAEMTNAEVDRVFVQVVDTIASWL